MQQPALGRNFVYFRHLDAAVTDDRAGLCQLDGLIDAFGMDDGISGQRIGTAIITDTGCRHGLRHSDRVAGIDDGGPDMVEPASPAPDLLFRLFGRLGRLAAVIGEKKMRHSCLRFGVRGLGQQG